MSKDNAKHVDAAEEENAAIHINIPKSFWQDDWQDLIKSHHEWLDACEKDEEVEISSTEKA